MRNWTLILATWASIATACGAAKESRPGEEIASFPWGSPPQQVVSWRDGLLVVVAITPDTAGLQSEVYEVRSRAAPRLVSQLGPGKLAVIGDTGYWLGMLGRFTTIDLEAGTATPVGDIADEATGLAAVNGALVAATEEYEPPGGGVWSGGLSRLTTSGALAPIPGGATGWSTTTIVTDGTQVFAHGGVQGGIVAVSTGLDASITLRETGASWVACLAVTRQRLYAFTESDAETLALQAMPRDRAGSAEVITTLSKHNLQCVGHGDRLYYLEGGRLTMLDPGGAPRVLASGLGAPAMALHVDDRGIYWVARLRNDVPWSLRFIPHPS